MLDDIALFIHIVQQGGLSAAARHLDLPAATVTRRLQKLEQELGSQLLHRSARQCQLTQEGEVYYQAYADLVEQFNQARQQLSRDLRQLSGRLKVLAPSNISNGILKPMWISFCREYPEIQLELVLSNQLQDMISLKADLALRIGPQPDSLLYQKRLGAVGTVLVAAPDYLKAAGEPEHPLDLKQHRQLGVTMLHKWPLQHSVQGTLQEIYPRFSVQVNDTTFVRDLVLDGQGIALLPLTEVQELLQQGYLKRVLPEWQGVMRELYAVWPSGKLLSLRAQCLRDYMQNYIHTYV
ncbi:LysR family transcriptional regulator [Neptuniibacter halophilus]|uniref:LysR family transcriptional regulator n=1 Tax=Neptuniibacter halophilus TaxID=651666 RepID=UPI0025746C4E|nr:LysR family transcriptional regulator [Neptuniibacter halophilus]